MEAPQTGLPVLLEISFCFSFLGQFQPWKGRLAVGCQDLGWPMRSTSLTQAPQRAYPDRSKSGIDSSDVIGLCLLSGKAGPLSSAHGGVLRRIEGAPKAMSWELEGSGGGSFMPT